jgi:hypothetical protein
LFLTFLPFFMMFVASLVELLVIPISTPP